MKIIARLLKPFKVFWKLSWKKKIFISLGLILLAIAVKGIFFPPDPKAQYALEAAAYGSITEVVSDTGNVTAAGVTPIYSTTTGIVEEVLVANGDMVAENAILFKVNSTATKQEQDAALASYMAAKSALESAKATQLGLQAAMFGKWDEYKELAESDDYENADGTPRTSERYRPEFHIPEKEWLSAEAAYKNQEQIINEKSVAASAAWQAYQSTQDSQVVAVLGGQIQNLSVARGDLVAAPTAASLSSTAPVLVLVDDTIGTFIKLAVNENEAIKVQEGQPAVVEFEAINGKTFPAKVDRVDTVASGTQDVVEYAVYVKLDDMVDQVQRGMTADVDITVASKDDILTVPSSAVKPYQGGKAVRIVGAQGEIEYLPVEVGLRGGGKTEILSGIDSGTEVIVALANEQVKRSGGLF